MPYLSCPVCKENPIAHAADIIPICPGCNCKCQGDYCPDCSIKFMKCYSCGKNIKSGNEYIEDLIKIYEDYKRYFCTTNESVERYNKYLDKKTEKYKNKSVNEMISLCIKN